MYYLTLLSLIIGVMGIIIIVWGILLVSVEFLQTEYLVLLRKNVTTDKHALRQQLGSYILLGLEFMIAGDIIHTLIKPDREALIELGAIVAIRTVISYFLNKELETLLID